MISELLHFGVPPQVLKFFAAEEPIFDFGDDAEYFTADCHRLPVTRNLWTAGDPLARQVVITYSAMEAIAFLTVKRSAYRNHQDLFFIAIGSRLRPEQLQWIRQNLKGRNFTLVFGNDLLGKLTDIKVAAGIRNKMLSICYQAGEVEIRLKARKIIFEAEKLSLHVFEEAFGIRTKVRTCKPACDLTFLNQLKNEKSSSYYA
ncbi:hypothetical protein INP83_11200 [Mucilaginibacter sp. 21P]|uniref:hypothetical protein n=1 Tax=Mucilaginibacter sp. 21P TaxID=2778902 RepID=UPI001C59EDD9|nr:hypothetical protein [Mucilaginibacter sp. 21P]QXV63678.1 hypothetical protein INP83_11200 [Mucilaginibacter sp. 21P]